MQNFETITDRRQFGTHFIFQGFRIERGKHCFI